MSTPICNFVQDYAESDALRLHMPGHKGTSFLGMEQMDITEIVGADSLYEANGIICQSEAIASEIFGSKTFFSTEGSSHCIRAMLHLAMLYAKYEGKKPLIAAGRNVHKSFLSAAALLDFEIMWLYPKQTDTHLHCDLSPAEIESALLAAQGKPTAVYITSPDYLGNLANISDISKICRKHGVLLLVDNAHGAYLKFLENSLHPIDLGADMCCDSAHKTLPVLTGGAYLHISNTAPEVLAQYAKNALALFGSTSPSYLILQSLDSANIYLQDYPRRLREFLPLVENTKNILTAHGYCFYGTEPLKLTIQAKPYGYRGNELAAILQSSGVFCEFADPDFLVLMITPEIGKKGLNRLEKTMLSIPPKASLTIQPPEIRKRKQCLSIREALLRPWIIVPVSESNGKILASSSVGCPPAVPILVSGEQIDSNAISCFQYYGIYSCSVIIESPQTQAASNKTSE